VSDIDTAAVDSLKVLDPKRPIREVTHLRHPPAAKRAGLQLRRPTSRVLD